MKRITALALGLVMILCAVCAFAEEAGKTEMGTLNVGGTFRIRSRMPEGYTYLPVTESGLNMVGILSAGEGRPAVTVSIAYNEEYAEAERFNDVDEAVVEEIRESFREVDGEAVFEDLETAYGTRLLKVTGDDFVDLYTIYKSYELEFVMTGVGITEADVKMMVDFISDMDFIDAEPAAGAEKTPPAYIVRVTDQDDAPVAGVTVSFCTDSACVQRESDRNGRIVFTGAQDVYHVAVVDAPDGYAWDEDFEMTAGPEYGEWVVRVRKE